MYVHVINNLKCLVNEMFVESIVLYVIILVGCCIYRINSPFSFGSIKLRLVVAFVFLLILDSSWLSLNQQECISSHPPTMVFDYQSIVLLHVLASHYSADCCLLNHPSESKTNAMQNSSSLLTPPYYHVRERYSWGYRRGESSNNGPVSHHAL